MTGLLAAGAITAGVTAANANTAGFCTGTGTDAVGNTPAKAANCIIVHTITSPATIFYTVNMTKGGNQLVNTTWRAQCTLDGVTKTNFGGFSGTTPFTQTLVIPLAGADSCDVTVSATQAKAGAATMAVTLSYAPRPGTTPTPTPTPTSASGTQHMYRGLGGKCVDALHNGSANRTKVTIFTCNRKNKAQYWTYANGYLKHNGKCLNDQRYGGNGSKVILYTCNGGSNEIWTHRTNGEWVMKARGGKYCLDDPASSRRNGTQLIVWVCHNSTNQHWYASTVR